MVMIACKSVTLLVVPAVSGVVGGALNVDVRNARAGKPTLQFFLKLQVFVQQIGVVALSDPVRMPAAVEA